MRTLTILNLLIWCGLVWLGIEGLQGVQSQNVAGYPNDAQVTYYLRTPIAMAVGAVAAFALARLSRYKRTALVLQIAVLLAFFPFIVYYTGGV